MSTTTTDRTAATAPRVEHAPHPVRGALRRLWSLSRAELLLLRRNRTLLSIALLLPVGVVLLLSVVDGDLSSGGAATARAIGSLVGMLLLFVVYYNVLSTSVARREEGVLQRLRTGEAADAEVLAALALPSVAITLLQSVLMVGVGRVVLDLPLPGNPLLVLLGVLVGSAVLSVLALVTAVATRTLEAVQMTSLPVLAVCVLGAGLALPLSMLPPAMAEAAAYTPLSQPLLLVQEGWTGDPTATGVLTALGVSAAWVVLGALVVRARFRWSPRS